ncbi:MAG: type VI secretion system secreted protein VgrG [Planctomycetota bacterium]|jgi:type VI secretion system secreted protein VgrG
MSNFAQTGRYLKLKTPLADDELLLAGFSGHETFSNLFHFELDLASLSDEIDPAKLVGKEISWTIDDKGVGERHFAGIVRRFSAGGADPQGFRRYHAVVVPKMWLLTRREGCRIFQELSVVDIISSIFDELGVTDVDVGQLMATYKPLEFVVQWRESDFAFVSRLMEEFGIFYFHTFTDGAHKLVLADDSSTYQPCALDELPFHEANMIGHRVTAWSHEYEMTSGAVAFRDFDYIKPSTDLGVDQPTLLKIPTADLELYDYPGRYLEGADGDSLAKAKMEAEEARFDIVNGSSTCPAFTLAATFKLSSGHGYAEELGVQRVLTSVTHSGSDSSHHQSGGGSSYSNSFTCLPSDIAGRAQRTTARPRVQGPQTAIVTGPSGEEIHTDEHGRIKVKFHWDRSPDKDDKSSCWIRVSQAWAGKNWGAQFLPRVGQEVIVEFLNGDPDRPIVTGCVYNGEQVVPYDLPANKTQSGTKSRSSKEAGAANFNEIRFEDKKGSEELYLHAEKDENHIVESNQALVVGNDQTITVGNDRNEEIKNDRNLIVAKNKSEDVGETKTITVGSDHTETIAGDMQLSVDKGRIMSVGKDLSEDVGAGMTLNVGKDRSMTVGGALEESVAKDSDTKVDGAHTLTVKKESTYKGKKIQIKADDEIQLVTGSASITMKKNGDIVIKGKKITVKGSGDVAIKGSKIGQN